MLSLAARPWTVARLSGREMRRGRGWGGNGFPLQQGRWRSRAQESNCAPRAGITWRGPLAHRSKARKATQRPKTHVGKVPASQTSGSHSLYCGKSGLPAMIKAGHTPQLSCQTHEKPKSDFQTFATIRVLSSFQGSKSPGANSEAPAELSVTPASAPAPQTVLSPVPRAGL